MIIVIVYLISLNKQYTNPSLSIYIYICVCECVYENTVSLVKKTTSNKMKNPKTLLKQSPGGGKEKVRRHSDSS